MERLAPSLRTDAPRLTAYVLLGLASVLLAAEPLIWLWRSWVSAAYGSYGWAYAAAVVALAGWSLASGRARGAVPVVSVLLLAGLAAGLRLTGQVLAINVISACALAVDVYALAKALRLEARPRPISPGWLAALFLFALPLQMIVERVLGYPLQLFSAELACKALSLIHSDLACAGTRITVAGHPVLVDLPCAGAAGLVLTLAVFTGLTALYRPRLWVAMLGGLAVLGLAVLGNALRVTILAHGLSQGWPVMDAPWHDLTGLLSLALVLGPVFWGYRPSPVQALSRESAPLPAARLLTGGILACAAALTIVSLKGRPVDVSRPLAPITMPAQLRGHLAQSQPLSPLEERYFRAYGGQAAKTDYGPMTAILVRTTSPLRHLHDPSGCLRGMGYRVRFLGTRLEGLPTAIYRAEGPEGDLWQVEVSFVSASGQAHPAIGAAVWAWLLGPGEAWSSIQRITPLAHAPEDRAAWDMALIAALDIPQNPLTNPKETLK